MNKGLALVHILIYWYNYQERERMIGPSPMQMPMPNLALKNIKILYLTFDAPIRKCYFKCYFVILLFLSCKN